MVKRTMESASAPRQGDDDIAAKLRTWALHSNGHFNLVHKLLAKRCLCMSTGTSTTVDKLRQQGIDTATAEPPQFLSSQNPSTCRRNNRHITILFTNCNCGIPRAALSGPKPLSCTTTGKTPNRRPAQQGHRRDLATPLPPALS